MSGLARLNRDEWADVLFVIALRGGPGDGERFRWRAPPRVLRYPLPAEVVSVAAPTTYPLLRVAEYAESGSVTDSGAHIYHFACHSP